MSHSHTWIIEKLSKLLMLGDCIFVLHKGVGIHATESEEGWSCKPSTRWLWWSLISACKSLRRFHLELALFPLLNGTFQHTLKVILLHLLKIHRLWDWWLGHILGECCQSNYSKDSNGFFPWALHFLMISTCWGSGEACFCLRHE